MRKNNRDAFTLIELLAVIAIILLLLSLLLPVLSSARERSERVTCTSDLKQMETIMELYASDHDGTWPCVTNWAFSKLASTTINGIWAEWACYDVVSNGVMFAYVKDTRIFVCPTFRRVYAAALPAAANLTPYCSYTMNEHIHGDSLWILGNSLTRALVQLPSKQGVFGEEGTWICSPYGGYMANNMRLGTQRYDYGQPLGNPTHYVDCVSDFHGPNAFDVEKGFTDVSFADGHVGPVHPIESKEVFNPYLVKQPPGQTGGF